MPESMEMVSARVRAPSSSFSRVDGEDGGFGEVVGVATPPIQGVADDHAFEAELFAQEVVTIWGRARWAERDRAGDVDVRDQTMGQGSRDHGR